MTTTLLIILAVFIGLVFGVMGSSISSSANYRDRTIRNRRMYGEKY